MYGSEVPIVGTVTNCRFTACGGSAVLYYEGDGGSFVARNNKFTNVSGAFMLWEDNEGCDILITKNKFRGVFGMFPVLVLPGSTATIKANHYNGLESCLGGCIINLESSGNEVYENLNHRTDLIVFGDPETNVIVLDYAGNGKK